VTRPSVQFDAGAARVGKQVGVVGLGCAEDLHDAGEQGVGFCRNKLALLA